MNKSLHCYFISFLLLLGCLANSKSSFGQATATFAYLSGGLATNPIGPSLASQVPVYGFSVQASSGNITFSTFYIGCQNGPVNAYLTNGTLYRSTTSSFNSANPGTPVGNVTFGTTGNTSVTISNLSETVLSTAANPTYYFLVADVIYSGSGGYCQLFINSMTVGVDVNNVNYNSGSLSQYNGYNYTTTTAYPVSITNTLTATGLTSPSTIITSGTMALPLFGFSITTTSNSTFSSLKINSNVATIANYFTNFKLYSNTSNSYTGSTQVTGLTVSTSGAYVVFNTSGTTLSASATIKYYFLVADCAVTGGGSVPANVQFSFTDGQSSAALTRATPGVASYNDFTAYGNTYNINSTIITVTSLLGGTTSGTLTANQTGVVLFGFSVQPTGAITISGFNINSTNTAASYFGNAKLYSCTTNNYSTGVNTLVSGATVNFSGNYAVVTGISEAFTASQTKNYFLVADNTGGAASSTITFNFTSGQSSNAITQSNPTTSFYNTFSISGNTLTLPPPTLLVIGENSTSTNGITPGNLTYGQTGIVLYGFGVQAFGASFSLATINIKAPGNENAYFSNGSLYRSTSPVFPGGTPLYSGIAINGGGNIPITVTETIPTNTTYYYFFTADYSVANGPAATGYAFSFSTSQSGGNASLVTNPYNTYSYNVTGNGFTIIGTEDWTGGTSSDFTIASNFTLLTGGGGFTPTTTTVVRIGGVTYNNAPAIAANTSIAGITFGSVKVSTLTINSGETLTLSNGVSVLAGSTATVTGPGTLTLSSGSTSLTAGSAILDLNGGVTVNNAGAFITGASSVINLSGSSKLANTGTFTLASTSGLNLNASTLNNTGTFTFGSDANGTAYLGPLVGSNTITGNYIVQRYITGGSLTYRGYRSLSSPVTDPTSPTLTPYYNLSFLKGSGTYLTGAAGGGFDATGAATILLYNQSFTPNNTSLNTGVFRAITAINNATHAYTIGTIDGNFNLSAGNGYFLFFRGNNSTNISATPNSLTFNMTGTLNHGQYTVNDWYTSPSTSQLGYTGTGTTGTNSAVRGFNLVGNPYPSSIDWHTNYLNTTTTTGICCSTNLSNSIYVYNPATKNYSIYTNNSATTGTPSGATGGSNIIPSGQAFFVQATGTGARLIFNESAKVNMQASPLLLNALPNPIVDHHLRLQLFKDTINKDETVIIFNPSATAAYADNEDATYLQGAGQVNLSNMTSDNVAVGLNVEPFPKTTQTIGLNVIATSDGNYQLKMTEVSNIPNLFDVWLKDAYMKDSLDIKHNPDYSFNLTHSDASSVSLNRFTLVIRQNAAYAYHLLSFNGAEVKGGAQLNWTTENEDTFTTFALQRSTDGGKIFSTLSTMTSNSGSAYSYLDTSPAAGQNQYRLQITDVNGVISYSNVITLLYASLGNNTITVSNISIYPNPAKDVINVSISGGNASSVTYTATIINSDGSVVRKISSLQSPWQSSVSDLSPGVYILRVVDATNQQVAGVNKFIKL